tara:strand:+ start:356 stop:1264 length:909 start_codon:yes stop_codon:yes gene_type:complete
MKSEAKAAGRSLNNPQRLRVALLKYSALHDNAIIIALTRFWARQAMDVVTEDVIRAIDAGMLETSITDGWRESWSSFMESQLNSDWASATLEGAGQMQQELRSSDEKVLSRILERLRQWREARRAKVSRTFADTQRDSVNEIVRVIGRERGGSASDVRRIIRSSLGLTRRQSKALIAIWDALQEQGVTGLARATRIVDQANRMQTIRARRIAKTELALAFNAGAHEQMREYIEKNSLLESNIVKIWVTAGDDKVCGFCQEMSDLGPQAFAENYPGKNWDEGNSANPPAHPSCRCVIEYRDVS